ncbi:TPR end-of-group domain-containing protein [Kosmotoga pacifica]|uniref:Uncharacterized protein n=1 Tax=Kosmotoga pacifica TaxID=1330330 RepID=A0A0G2ZAQ4_9BACT|nr:dienelactone hydrolase family protein [Kosmotoga pacifica]AKI97176.1 hypothetical protein IX53_04405 [Kosmotoga pacifica]
MKKKSFHDYQNEFFDLYLAGKIAEALKLIDEIEIACPDMAYRAKYWKACIHSLRNEKDMAIKALKELRDMGYWLSPEIIQRDRDLENIKEEPEYIEILNVFKQRQADAAKLSAPLKVELSPSGVSDKLPLIVALHWRMGNAEEFSIFWKDAVENGKARLLALQSSQQVGTGLFCWDNVKIAKKEVKEQVQEYLSIHSSMVSQLILGGASQGADLALELALEGELKPEKLVLVVPAFRDVDYIEELIKNNKNSFKIYIIAGGKDMLLKRAKTVKELLTENNISCMMNIYPDMGHTFPEDFNEVLLNILDE